MEGKYTERWRAMILQAESPQALDWVERMCERRGYLTPELAALVAQRRAEVGQ